MRLPYRLYSSLPLAAFALMVVACHPAASPNGQTVLVANNSGNSFAEYWYAGEAEVNTYELKQSRYGEMRDGEAIMVFVTEDFSKSKHVKMDQPGKEANDKVSIMKLNFLKRFVTGIYDYSMMESVFTPIDIEKFPHSLKTTTSSQDWCGHSFTQLNLEGEKYRYNQFSYFENEGDVTEKILADLIEDELWNRLRIDPESIKEGNYELIPSSFYSRLSHDPLSPRQARITYNKDNEINYLVLEYMHLDRTLTIGYAPNFPYKILSWTEVQDGEIMSKGKLKSSMKSAYWGQHDNHHEFLRDSLGI